MATWMDDWIADWLIDCWLTDMLIVQNSMMDRLIDWLIDWLNDQLIRFNFLLPWIIAVYQKVSYQTFHAENVFYEEKTVHNLGKARYQMDLVKSERFPITNEFAAAVCNLPQIYDRMAYHRFIKDWGTVGFWINFVTSLTFNLKKFGQVFTMASVHCVNEEYLFAKFWVIYIYIYIHIIVTRTLRPTKVHCARRINRDSQSKPHSKHKRREFKKMRGWKTSDVKKIKNLIKTFLLNFLSFYVRSCPSSHFF